ncbi:MAG: IS1182 family transposase [Bacteroidota bacterium]|nr:IS1182 family transposase [Bacteroidota bacterium]
MQGKKQYQEKLFINFQLSEYIPEDNFYRRLKESMDFNFLYKMTSKYYGKEGQKSIDPVVFMKLMLVGYLENINSDRRIISISKMRMDILYFIGYDLEEELPWHSTLSRTRQLYGQEIFTSLFKIVLKQCIDKGMVAGRRQAVDGVFVKANASLDSMVKREIMKDAEAYGNELEANVEEKATVVNMDINNSKDSNGLKPKKNPGNKTHYSPSDPDAKMSVKPGKATALNYLGEVSVDTSSHVITHIQAFSADKKDGKCLAEMLGSIIENMEENGLKVEEVVADKGFSCAEALKALERRDITGYIPSRGQFIYERPGFTYYAEGDYYNCPNNEKLVYKGTYQTLPGVYNKEYKLSRKICNSCQLSFTCPVYEKRESIIRETVEKNCYQRMHQRMQSSQAKRIMRQRQSTVEPVIGTLVNYLGMKRVNTKGLIQANKCITMAAVAYNIKKLMKHLTNQTISNTKAIKRMLLVAISNTFQALLSNHCRIFNYQ